MVYHAVTYKESDRGPFRCGNCQNVWPLGSAQSAVKSHIEICQHKKYDRDNGKPSHKDRLGYVCAMCKPVKGTKYTDNYIGNTHLEHETSYKIHVAQFHIEHFWLIFDKMKKKKHEARTI